MSLRGALAARTRVALTAATAVVAMTAAAGLVGAAPAQAAPASRVPSSGPDGSPFNPVFGLLGSAPIVGVLLGGPHGG
jgi:hypothetical protein